MSSSLTERTRAIPPEMLLDLAAGVEEPVDIAFRYGFTASEFKKLEQSQQFLQEVAQQRAENDRTGVTAQTKAGFMYDMVAERYFMRVMANDVALGALAQAVDTFATLGNRKPKQNMVQAAPGSGFQVIINLPGRQVASAVADGSKAAYTFPTFDNPVTDVEVTHEPSDLHPTTESGTISDIGQVHQSGGGASGKYEDDSGDTEDSVRGAEDSTMQGWDSPVPSYLGSSVERTVEGHVDTGLSSLVP
jgi:hypothetical protein